jgi:hypothetical protein
MQQKILLFILLFFILVQKSIAQGISVQLGEKEIGVNETFTITATVEDGQIKECTGFPEIQGFTKVGTGSSTNMSIVNGKMSYSQSLVQNYRATQQGTFTIPNFTMKINGQSVAVKGASIKVVAKRQQQSQDPFADFFGFNNSGEDDTEFLDVKEDAFFAIMPNKTEVYEGEGVNITVAMYIAEANRAFLEFHDIGQQLGEILKKIKPANCWEENFNIEELVPEIVTIKGKPYRQYKIYQANYYPINVGTITIPETEFMMIKYKIAKNPQFFGNNTEKAFVGFKSKEKKITVKPLPAHPLKGSVAVGNFRLNEEISSEKLQTGTNFSYKFQLIGEGNISAITPPKVQDNPYFDFYPPNERIQINRKENTVYGSKQFTYMAVPTESGSYNFGEYFQWIFFNTQKGTYDTLKSRLRVTVTGESKAHTLMDSTQIEFFDLINNASNSLQSREPSIAWYWFINSALIGIVGFLGYLLFLQSKQGFSSFRENKLKDFFGDKLRKASFSRPKK